MMREDILKTVAVMVQHPSATEHELVQLLVAQGYDVLRAEVLVVFVPLGLARAVIRRLPVNPPVRFATTGVVPDPIQKRNSEFELENVPEFVEAQELGEETFQNGVIPRAQFAAAIKSSAELNNVHQVLQSGRDLGGAYIGPSVFLRLADTPGFEAWYQKVCSKRSDGDSDRQYV